MSTFSKISYVKVLLYVVLHVYALLYLCKNNDALLLYWFNIHSLV